MKFTVTKSNAETNNTNSNSSIGFGGLLTIVFIALKLTHYIDWSWWWVLCPLWIGMAICLGLFLMGLIVAAIAAILKG